MPYLDVENKSDKDEKAGTQKIKKKAGPGKKEEHCLIRAAWI